MNSNKPCFTIPWFYLICSTASLTGEILSRMETFSLEISFSTFKRVRIICNANRISHVDPLFQKLNALKIDDLYEQAIRIFSFKLSRNMRPHVISSMFTRVNHGHNTRTAKKNFFVMRSDRHSIKTIAPKCWNSLPLELKYSPSLSSLKAKSKNSLIHTYGAFNCQVSNCISCLASKQHLSPFSTVPKAT